MELVFVILHYCSVNDTIECIESIKSCMTSDDYKIVVVDNKSPDNSYSKLCERYNEDRYIKLTSTLENIGFAKGNNVGIRIARNEFDPEFIVVMNNDICLLQNNPNEVIRSIYEKHPFAVMGPMVLSKDGRYDSNPKGNHVLSVIETRRAIKRAQRILWFNKLGLGGFYLKLEALKNKIWNFDDEDKLSKYTQTKHGYILHGCCLVFSKNYFVHFDGFDERTFLYMEEEILYKHLRDKDLEIVYSPDWIVFHKEDASTNSMYRKSKDKLDFVLRNNIISYQKYLEMFEDGKQ